ncbi:MAG: hypothetical protein NDI87_12600 [Rhodoferax sp.]|nr:hypothetical protein [Rhodoferax sp.]
MRVTGEVKIDTFMRRALNANPLNPGNMQVLANPACQVFVSGLLKLLIEQTVIQLRNGQFKLSSEPVNFTPREMRPSFRRRAPHRCQKTVSVQTA